MRQGRDIQALAKEIQRQHDTKQDYLADSRNIRLYPPHEEGGGMLMQVTGLVNPFGVTHHAHGQIAERTNIPRKYYDRMAQEAPSLLASNVNHWFEAHPEPRMVRTLDRSCRAFLSDSYRALDNYDVAAAVLPTLTDAGVRIESCEITETRMYIKAVSRRVERYDAKVGDTVAAGFVLRNSEVGHGALAIERMVWKLLCTNGMVSGQAMRKAHLGRKHSTGVDLEFGAQHLSDASKALDDAALWSKVQDAMRYVLSEESLDASLVNIHGAADRPVPAAKVVQVVEVTAKRLSLNQQERSGVLEHLIDGGDLSQWGLVNALTRHSQDVESYERASEMERMGGAVIELGDKDWQRVLDEAERVKVAA